MKKMLLLGLVVSILLLFSATSPLPAQSINIPQGYHVWDSPMWVRSATIGDVVTEMGNALDDIYGLLDKLNDQKVEYTDLLGFSEDVSTLKKSMGKLSDQVESMETQIQDLSKRLDTLEARKK